MSTLPAFANTKANDVYVSDGSLDNRGGYKRQQSHHDDLRAMSAPFATVCSEAAIKPLIVAAAYNLKASLAKALRELAAVGSCQQLATMPQVSDEAMVWTGKVRDDGGVISLVVYETITFTTVSQNTIWAERGFLLCWYTDEVFHCF